MISFRLAASIAALSTIRSALATAIIYPIYLYPGDSCSAWSGFLSYTAEYPTVTFYYIVNPDSGPGASSTPDSNYQACIPQLRSSANSNVILLGYVDTAYATKSTTDVEAEVTIYANWPSAYHVDGIFFDDVEATTTYESYYSTLYTNVKSHSGLKYVTLNPGIVPNSAFYAYADLIVTAETYYSEFSLSQLTISTATPAAKQVVILHDGPTVPPVATIDALSNAGIKAIYITDITAAEEPYEHTMDNYSTFVADVAATV